MTGSMHTDEVAVDEDLVRRLLAAQHPQWAELPIEPVPPCGTDNAIYRLGDDLCVRLPRRPGAVAQVDREQRWLPVLAPHLPLEIPMPAARGEPAEGYPFPWAVLSWVPGGPASVDGLGDLETAAADLSRFVTALQGVDAAGGPAPSMDNFGRGAPLSTRDAHVRAALASLAAPPHDVDVAAAAGEWERTIAAPRWSAPAVWVHGDLTADNLVVRDGRLRGVIDFGCLGVGDPAVELLPAWELLAPALRRLPRRARRRRRHLDPRPRLGPLRRPHRPPLLPDHRTRDRRARAPDDRGRARGPVSVRQPSSGDGSMSFSAAFTASNTSVAFVMVAPSAERAARSSMSHPVRTVERMSVVDAQGQSWEREVAWRDGEAATVAAVGALNLATVALVETIGMLVDTGGWVGHGIGSLEHWVCWKANVSRRRVQGLVAIARRREDLPICWGLFRAGRLTEDAMVRIARRVPADRDAEVAALAPSLLISQLTRVLAVLPELPDPDATATVDPDRYLRTRTTREGWVEGQFCLPPDEGAAVLVGLGAARDAEFRDRNDLDPATPVVDRDVRSVDWADALVRLASEGTDALDPTCQRTGYRGERHQVVLHHHLDRDGRMGPGRLHLGGFVTDPVARYLACDAKVIAMAYDAGRLLGINPTDRTPSRRLRRYLEHRDGGCAHPLCTQRRWLHVHHLRHWEDGGPTTPDNLLCLCPRHHRGLHMGDFTIHGHPEAATIEFRTPAGERIEPPEFGAHPLQPPADHHHYTQPYGGRLITRDFSWS